MTVLCARPTARHAGRACLAAALLLAAGTPAALAQHGRPGNNSRDNTQAPAPSQPTARPQAPAPTAAAPSPGPVMRQAPSMPAPRAAAPGPRLQSNPPSMPRPTPRAQAPTPPVVTARPAPASPGPRLTTAPTPTTNVPRQATPAAPRVTPPIVASQPRPAAPPGADVRPGGGALPTHPAIPQSPDRTTPPVVAQAPGRVATPPALRTPPQQPRTQTPATTAPRGPARDGPGRAAPAAPAPATPAVQPRSNDPFSRPLAPRGDSARPSVVTNLADAGRHDGGFHDGPRDGFHGGSRHDGFRDGRFHDDRFHDGHFHDGHHSSTHISVGIGIGFGGWYDPYPYRGTCLAYDPFWYGPRSSFTFVYGAYDPWWRCRPRPYYFAYYDPWCYRPYWYHPHLRLSYSYLCAPRTTWIINYGSDYGCAPSYTFSTCGLIGAGAVNTVTDSGMTWSTNGLYRYGWIGTAPAVEAAPAIASENLPAPATQAELLGTSNRELGDTYLRLGDLGSAVRIYSDHAAAHPGDVHALRSLGIALIASGQPDAGLEQIDRAYRIDPTLARAPFPIADLPDRLAFQQVLDEATRRASTDNSLRAWLAVAALMQADGQNSAARSALDRAKAAGLGDRIVQEFQAAMPIPAQ